MGKHQPNEKHPDGQGKAAGGNLCRVCGGSGGPWVSTTQTIKGKTEKIDTKKPCSGCGK